MIIIVNDDEHYLRWINENPNGYVVNAQNPPSPNNLVLHRSSCSHISSSKRSNWTTKDYLKVCSNNADELTDWASKATGGELNSCQQCKSDTCNQSEKSSVRVVVFSPTAPKNEAELPFMKYPEQGRRLLGKRSVENSRRGYGLTLRRLTGLSSCAYCGMDLFNSYEHWLLLQVDHVIPTTVGKRLGIPVEWLEDYSNLVLACSACNSFDNQFDDPEVIYAPQTEDEFFDLRDAVFTKRKPRIYQCQSIERSFFDGKPWEKK